MAEHFLVEFFHLKILTWFHWKIVRWSFLWEGIVNVVLWKGHQTVCFNKLWGFGFNYIVLCYIWNKNKCWRCCFLTKWNTHLTLNKPLGKVEMKSEILALGPSAKQNQDAELRISPGTEKAVLTHFLYLQRRHCPVAYYLSSNVPPVSCFCPLHGLLEARKSTSYLLYGAGKDPCHGKCVSWLPHHRLWFSDIYWSTHQTQASLAIQDVIQCV